MPKKCKDIDEEPKKERRIRRLKPAIDPESRENQLIAYAIDSVEERILNKKATSQELLHFLKLGSTKERLEKEILKKQKDLLEAKTESIKSNKRMEELYSQAMESISSLKYNGLEEVDDSY